MTAAHTALIVEDDPHIAEILKELVASRAHKWIHASTLEEAARAIDAGGFCYALLDMQIPADATSPPKASCGETVLELLRKHDSSRNEAGKHRLQVIVVSSYSRDPEFVSKMHELEADSFLAKPFGAPPEVVTDKIRECLARAGRTDHESCGSNPGEGRGLPSPSTSTPTSTSTSTPTSEVRLIIDGERKRRRSGLLVCGERRDIQDSRFVIFLRFVIGHLDDPNVWQSKEALGMTRDEWAPSRIRTSLSKSLPKGFELIEADRAGSFRLNPAVIIERVDWAALEKHPDPAVQKIAREARRKKH